MTGFVKKRINDLEVQNAELENLLEQKVTLRDQFAMSAVDFIFRAWLIDDKLTEENLPAIAEAAFNFADLMLVAREKTLGD